MSLDDAAARTCALDPTASFIVEAAAGSGKTSLLTQRMLVLLARVDEPENVLAVTFTRKAVEEMRGRVLEALALVDAPPPAAAHQRLTYDLAQAVLARDAERGWGLRAHPARLRVQTIDALAAGLARRLPLTAGLAAQLDVVDDASDLYRAAARETIACLLDDDAYADAVERVLEHLENDMRRLESLLIDMLARRDLWLPRVVDGADRGQAEAALAAVVAAELDGFRRSMPAALRGLLPPYARQAADGLLAQHAESSIGLLEGWDGQRYDADLCAALADLLLTQKGLPRAKIDRRQGVTTANKAQMLAQFAAITDLLHAHPEFCTRLQAVRGLPPVTYTAAQWRTVEAMYGLLNLALAQLALTFADAGRCDFTAVTFAAREALGAPEAPSELGLALDYRLEHLLVDEFQDTSATQHALLSSLTAGWTGEDGRTVFFVGDPLQSIYRFRQAEVGLFIATTGAGRWGEVPLDTLRLTANFRTSAPLVEWINGALAQAFADAPDILPPYVPLSATRPAGAGPPLSVVAIDEDEQGKVDTTLEALAVLRVIEDARARRPQASIAVLVRSRSHLGLLPPLLAAARVPVAATDIEPLTDAPVVNDLMLLTRALCQPADRIAWLALLRAPWCGIGLAALTTLVEGQRDRLVRDALRDPTWRRTLADDERQRVEALCTVTDAALAQVRRLPWSQLVERVWLELNGPALVSDPATLRHALRFLELLARFEAVADTLTAESFGAFLARHYAPVPRDAGTAVQIMTIHRAKGLEFDIVIVPGVERRVQGDPRRLALWVEHRAALAHGALLAPLSPPGHDDEPIYTYLRALDAEEQRAESYRLLYVALTRAKDELHLCARRGFDRDGELKRVPSSFLGMLGATLATPLFAARSAAQADTQLPPAPTRQRLTLASLPRPGERIASLPTPQPMLEFEWASPTAKHVGTVTHLLLELIGQQGLAAWDPAQLPARLAFIRFELTTRGVPRGDLEAAAARVSLAIEKTLTSARGRWIFDDAHTDRASERHYTAVLDGDVVEAVLDRSFVDAEGVRWIVDFKTGEHLGGSANAFLDREVERYRPQLERYAQVMQRIDARPIALGLYFPLLDGWREWRYRA